MGYKLAQKTKVNLSQLGEDSSGNPFFVEIKNPKMMTYGERNEFLKLAKDIAGSGESNENKSLKEIASKLILSWNLISLFDESPLPIPAQDQSAFDKVPAEALDIVFREMANSMKVEDQDTKNLSAQLAKSSESGQLLETSTSEDTTN